MLILDRVEAFVDAAAAGAAPAREEEESAFDRLALDVFAFQYENVPLYRRLCDLRGVPPSDVDHWSRIPAAPADIFKEDLGVAAHAGATTFLSSGTSQGAERRSAHVVGSRSFELYRRSSVDHFRAMVMPDGPGPMSVLVLGPTSDTHPASSLGHMYRFVADAVAADCTQAFDADGRLDVDAAVAWLERAAAGTSPVLLLALSSTITSVFEALRSRKLALRLPADSRLVDTGGNKGGHSFSRSGLLKAAWRFLHIPAYLCVGEYGMTELLSQFYDDAWHSRWSGGLSPRSKIGPAWTRTLVVDPATLAPVADGERGILRHVDLANVASISAVQTLDVGVSRGNGFEVLGRASGAEARGCSRLMAVLRPDE
ncbi:MAG: hypothetical protein ABR538_06780 [Candidatus Binatia bacterium]